MRFKWACKEYLALIDSFGSVSPWRKANKRLAMGQRSIQPCGPVPESLVNLFEDRHLDVILKEVVRSQPIPSRELYSDVSGNRPHS